MDSMVGTVLTIEREIEDALDIRAVDTGGKRDDQSSSNSRKRQKTSTSQGFQGQGQDYQDKGQDKAFGKAGQVICYFCRQPGHMRRDCPHRQGSQDFGVTHSQSSVGRARTQFIPPPPSTSQRNQHQSQGATQAPLVTQAC